MGGRECGREGVWEGLESVGVKECGREGGSDWRVWEGESVGVWEGESVGGRDRGSVGGRECRRECGRPVHPPYSSVFVTEFNPEYENTDLLIWLRKRSSPKYGNAHHLNIFFMVIS